MQNLDDIYEAQINLFLPPEHKLIDKVLHKDIHSSKHIIYSEISKCNIPVLLKNNILYYLGVLPKFGYHNMELHYIWFQQREGTKIKVEYHKGINSTTVLPYFIYID